jgi:GNAT superfamily N-acetyltransferase
VIIRATTPDDVAALDTLLHDELTVVRRLSLYRPLHGPPVDEPRLRRSFVAVDGQSLVGVGSALASIRHPARNQLAVHVERRARRQGVGSTLVAALGNAMAAAGHQKPWQVTVLTTDSISTSVLDHLGWTVRTVSRSGTLDVREAQTRHHPPEGFRVERVEELDPALVELYEAVYDEHHEWAGPYVRYAGGRSWIGFLGDPLPGSVHVAVGGGGEPVAVASLHGDRECPVLAPTGARRGTPAATAVVAALVDSVLRWAKDAGIGEIEWEADDAYADLWSALRPQSLDRWDDLAVYTSDRP